MHELSIVKNKLINNELNPGESLKWWSEPSPAAYARKGLIFAIAGLPFVAFIIFWILGAAKGIRFGGVSITFALFGLLPLVISLGITLYPVWLYYKAKNIFYAVTNERAIIFDGIYNCKIHSFRGSDLDNCVRKQKLDGSGDISFQSMFYGDDPEGRPKFRIVGFFGIKNVKEVERMLDELRNNSE